MRLKSNGNSTARTFNEVHQLTSVGGVAQTFDANGRLTQSQSGITLNWQAGSDRLDQTIVPSTATAGVEGTNDYGYDADNKRIWKKITRSGSIAEHTIYIYAGPNCIAEYAAGSSPATPDQEYIYGTSIDSLLQISHNNNAENFTVARNQQWSIFGLLKTTDGSIAELYSYDTFGDRTILSPNGTTIRTTSLYNNPYGYTSRRHDEESGLMYYRARYYDPESGEFLSQDPLEMVDGMSLYRAYFIPCGIDPSGLELIFDPKEVVGHPWRNALIGEWYTPALGGKKKFDHKAYGRTILDLSIEGVCTCKGGGNWTLEFELLLTTEILLNLELIAKGKRSPGGIIYTKENVYGHEQRHVLANRSKAIEIYVGLIIDFEGEFNDVGACHTALKKGMKEARTMWNTWKKQNPHGRNSNPLNPTDRKPYAPIDGVFPKAPGN